ncbi:hypothetical protein [Gaopeijia maritima]|uniref:hypothetical protein n=1 Tax=Gaopeijia maritima TaxID=3119007 RepID=UPI00327E0150
MKPFSAGAALRLLAALALVLPVTISLGASTAGSAPVALTVSDLLTTPVMFECDRVCAEDCATGTSHATFLDPDGASQGLAHGCAFGMGFTCDGGGEGSHEDHGCEPNFAALSPDQMDALWRHIGSGAIEGIGAEIRGLGEAVHLNVERSAVQVLGCGGSVVAHIPLSQGQLSAVLAEQ